MKLLFVRIPLAFLLTLLAAVPAQILGAPTSIKVFTDDSGSPISGTEITIPYHTTSLKFEVTPNAIAARYRLEGLDHDWQERSEEMYFMVRFLNDQGDQISQRAFPIIGRSAGWNGTIENSTFTSRQELVTVPPGTQYFSIAISSAGPPSLIGVYAATEINVKSDDKILLEDTGITQKKPSLWVKSGTHPTMARIEHFDEKLGLPAMLVIEDNDLTAHADLATEIYSLPQVTPGEILEISWKETYITSSGGAFSVNYDRLPPKSYRFIVQDLAITGVPLAPSTAVTVRVSEPIWENFWFWCGLILVTGITSSLIGRQLIRRRINRHLERAQLIADERLRIARDLHDDLGTRLSHISLLGSFAESNCHNEEDRASFSQITAMSRELVSSLSETVWMLNPKNNDLESLVAFLCRLVSELCRLKEIRCRINALTITQDLTISHQFRHNVSLAVKEVVNNVLKHSFATEIRMSIRLEGHHLEIVIADDGVGISDDSHHDRHGLGLENLARRMKDLGGTCKFGDTEGKGFRVCLNAPIA